jgi:hypothetical protein
MLFLWICAIMVVIARYPETPIGKILKHFLVDLPAGKLAQLTRTAMAFLVLVFTICVAAVLFGNASEGAMMGAQMAPETVGWFFAFDVGTYIDVIALALLAAATLSLRVVYQRARSALSSALRRVEVLVSRIAARSRTPRRRPGVRPPNTDDDGWAAAGFAIV